MDLIHLLPPAFFSIHLLIYICSNIFCYISKKSYFQNTFSPPEEHIFIYKTFLDFKIATSESIHFYRENTDNYKQLGQNHSF